jgi:prevent-host-death family protein
MSKIPSIIPISDLRQDSARVLKEARATGEPVFITQRGRATAVLLSVEAYRQAESERELLLLLARGEKEIASGVGHSLESVLAEADELLADD